MTGIRENPPRGWLAPVGAAAAAGLLVVLALGIGVHPPAAVPRSSSPCSGGLPSSATPIRHIFFLIKENHAFENYFGTFPGVLGGPPNGSFSTGGTPDRTVHPFPLNRSNTQDLPHDRGSLVASWDGGLNDRFVSVARQGGFPNAVDAVGYYTARQIPQYFAYARNYALGDRFFVGTMGPTLPNRIFDLAGTDANWTTNLAPPPAILNIPTILDQLSTACLPWSYLYAPGPGAVAPTFFPSIYGNPEALSRILPVDRLGELLNGSAPPALTYIDPSPNDNVSEHPPGNVSVGADWSTGIVDTIFSSPVANSSAVFLFFDENGGFWDPASPPVRTATGDGFRVPLLVLSPYTPRGVVNHETLDPSSLLRFVDDNFALPYLNPTVRAAPALSGFFDFASPARAPLLLPSNFTSTFSPPGPRPGSVVFGQFAAPSPPTIAGVIGTAPYDSRGSTGVAASRGVIYLRSDSPPVNRGGGEFSHRT